MPLRFLSASLLCAGVAGVAAFSFSAAAQPAPLELRYGPEQTVFGSCKPSLTLVNRSDRTLDYVQVDVAYRLRDGRERLAEHKSRYRTGLDNPVQPGEERLLVIHHDESVPLGAACGDIVAARIAAAECNGGAAAPCTTLAPRIGETLSLPAR